MKKNVRTLAMTTVAVAAALCATLPASAQVAGGTTTMAVQVTESTQVAKGWSVKKTLMGKSIYNDAGQKVGKVEDLIISPDKNVSYVIVGAGGFIGIGRHDVAIPVAQIQDKSGKLIMSGATKDSVKAMPHFDYAVDTSARDNFVAAADKDIAAGRAAVASLEKKVGTAATDARASLDLQLTALSGDLKSAEARLGEMKSAGAAQWRQFESSVSAATARLRKSIATATA